VITDTSTPFGTGLRGCRFVGVVIAFMFSPKHSEPTLAYWVLLEQQAIKTPASQKLEGSVNLMRLNLGI